MKKKVLNIILIGLFVLCLAVVIVFGIPDILKFSDEALGNLLSGALPRLAVGALLIVLILRSDYVETLKPKWKGLGRALLWSIPCFLVALANFPYTALIGGNAVIERADLLWLFLLKCLAIALFEELFFRALLLSFLRDKLSEHRFGTVISVLCSSALFALMHLVNLFFGAGIGETLLQVGYTFLIGCMLAVMLIKTRNVWLCVLVHFLFDVGGTIVTDLGYGPFQDLTFWILTAAAGVICFVHIIATLVIFKKKQWKI